MPFKRQWDATCPKIWDKFERDGRTYVIQDLAPEDDELALEIFMDQMCADEILLNLSDVKSDKESLVSLREFWKECLSQRMSLACYTEIDGKKTLVGMNVCVIDSENETFPPIPIKGAAWNNVYHGMAILEVKCNPFKHLNLDTIMHAYGLFVSRDFRGAKLGAKLLMAREPLALSQGVKGTSTVFTGVASQKLAASCGFVTICEMTLREIAENGFNYPKTDHVIKLMVKKFGE